MSFKLMFFRHQVPHLRLWSLGVLIFVAQGFLFLLNAGNMEKTTKSLLKVSIRAMLCSQTP
jgi:hypothetical protein